MTTTVINFIHQRKVITKGLEAIKIIGQYLINVLPKY